MSLLILSRVECPLLIISPPVYLSVAINARVERPSGATHFMSPRPILKGEVQIARWSFRMFRRKWLSSEGVGLACGVGSGSGCGDAAPCGFCAEAVSVMKMMKAQTTAILCDFETTKIIRRILLLLKIRGDEIFFSNCFPKLTIDEER